MTDQTYYLTPSLLLGSAPSALRNCAHAADFEEALDLVYGGQVAVLPSDGWDTARQVLSVLGLGPSDIEDRIHFARTSRPSPMRESTERHL